MHTGVGATAWASASQKWNGTAAAFTRKPKLMKAERGDHQPVVRAAERVPICAMFSAPVRP